MVQKENKIGIKVASPQETCDDKKCPFHGTLNVKNRVTKGKVIRNRMNNTSVIEMERRVYVPKYERYEKKRTKMKVHNPPCLKVEEGDIVKIALTRPISKTVNNVIVEVVEKHNETN
ncbi:MAG: 30S ribosomal protein S17 [Candidatus Woesearchaeota archaeon]